jgi:hypothetical protein
MSSFSNEKRSVYDHVSKQQHYRALTAHERHVLYMKNYVQFYSSQPSSSIIDHSVLLQDTDISALQRNHRFVRTEEDDRNLSTWEVRLAQRYYQKLFKEYCIVDLSRYKEQKLGKGEHVFSLQNQNITRHHMCQEASEQAVNVWLVHKAQALCPCISRLGIVLDIFPSAECRPKMAHRKGSHLGEGTIHLWS